MSEGLERYRKVEEKDLILVTRDNILSLAEEFGMVVQFKDGKAQADRSFSGPGLDSFAEGDLIDERGRKVDWPNEWKKVSDA